MAKTILIIDDDAEYVEAVSNTLQARGYRTESRLDAASGFSAAVASAPDLIILDIMMTYDSEGLDMASKLSSDAATCHIPVLLVTGIRHPEDLPVSADSVRGYLEKPVSPDVLIAAVEKGLR